MRATLYTILHFFIRENIIVASAVTALALSTFYIFHQPIAYPYLLSLWAGAILSYSFAKEGIFKYRDPLWWSCVLIVGYCFFLLNLQGKILLFLSGVLSILYNAPFLSQNRYCCLLLGTICGFSAFVRECYILFLLASMAAFLAIFSMDMCADSPFRYSG